MKSLVEGSLTLIVLVKSSVFNMFVEKMTSICTANSPSHSKKKYRVFAYNTFKILAFP